MQNTKTILTPNKKALYRNIDLSQAINVEDTTLEASENDIVLFTGSIMDKSEIDYRSQTNSVGTYLTIVPDDIDENDVDAYWNIHTIVLKKSIAELLLAEGSLENFLLILKVIKQWTDKSIGEYKETSYDTLNLLDINTADPTNTTDGFPPIMIPVATAALVGFGGMVSGFRGTKKQKKFVHILKYNPNDKKGAKALLLRLSSSDDENPFEIISIAGVTSKDELQSLYGTQHDMLEDFCKSEVVSNNLIYNGKELLLEKITSKVPQEMQLIILSKDGDTEVIFNDDKILDIEDVSNFALIKTYCSKEVSDTQKKIYKSFVENIKNFTISKIFQNEFAKIVQKSRNYFLIKQLRENDNASQELLQNFYYYLLDKTNKYANNANKDDKRTKVNNELSFLLGVIKSKDDVASMDDRFACNFYYYLRNTILKNNNEFLSLFENYKNIQKIDISILEQIEECTKKIGFDIHDTSDQVISEIIDLGEVSRTYDFDYLQLLKDKIDRSYCNEFSKDLSRVIGSNNHILSLNEDMENDKNDFNEVYQTSHEFSPPEKIIVDEMFSQRLANTLTYLDRLLTHPSLLTDKYKHYINVPLICDMIIMWSIQFRANEDSTLTRTKELIQKAYLTNQKPKEKKEEWTSDVVFVIKKLSEKHCDYDKYSNLIVKFDIEAFDIGLDREFDIMDSGDQNSFIHKNPYNYKLDDFISIRAAGDKFKKYYKEEMDSEDRFTLIIIKKLFGKTKDSSQDDGMMINILELIDKYPTDEKSTLGFLQASMDHAEYEAFQTYLSDIKQILCVTKYKNSSKIDDICLEYIHDVLTD